MQSDQLRAPWAITQKVKFYQTWNLESEVKYHNCPLKLFLGKLNDKISKKYKMPYFRPFVPK